MVSGALTITRKAESLDRYFGCKASVNFIESKQAKNRTDIVVCTAATRSGVGSLFPHSSNTTIERYSDADSHIKVYNDRTVSQKDHQSG